MRKGYILTEVMIGVVIAGSVAAVFTSMSYYTYLQSNMLKHQNTKVILEVTRSRLLNLAKDIDSDSYFELLKEEAGNTLPLNIGIGTDAWGKKIFYSTIDLGDANVIDPSYANTNTAISPNQNIAGRLISFGQNGTLETLATDDSSKGDDLMIEIGVGELNHFKLYGSSEITTQTRAYNSAIVSGVEPLTPINGTLWYDTATSKLKMYDLATGSWIEI